MALELLGAHPGNYLITKKENERLNITILNHRFCEMGSRNM